MKKDKIGGATNSTFFLLSQKNRSPLTSLDSKQLQFVIQPTNSHKNHSQSSKISAPKNHFRKSRQLHATLTNN